MLTGVYRAVRKDGTEYYRSSITYCGKHISLGSFSSEQEAASAYQTADSLLHSNRLALEDYKKEKYPLSFSKWVTLVNFRDNGMYIKTPIYLKQRFFYYYFSMDDYLTFDIDDLFYYSTRTISRRGGHLFVADYGMQVNILSRYGIKNFAVPGRDFRFVNGNNKDFRYENIEIINRFQGVQKKEKNGQCYYETKIHVNGDFIAGRYKTEIEAAIAYNKAASILITKGYDKNYPINFIEELESKEYQMIYRDIRISPKIRNLPCRG